MNSYNYKDKGLFGWSTGEKASIAVLGFPFDGGNPVGAGVRFGPKAIRTASQSLNLSTHISGIDIGDIRFNANPKILFSNAIDTLTTLHQRGCLPVLLGGDHSVSWAGVSAAVAENDKISVVWFDAHTDFCRMPENDWHDHKQVLRRISTIPQVSTIIQIGHRGITYFDETQKYEQINILSANISENELERKLKILIPRDNPVYVSIDIDVVDPLKAPGTGHPVPGGLMPDVVSRLAASIMHLDIKGIDLTEVNPLLDPKLETPNCAALILANIFEARFRDKSNIQDV